jgi:hypothetical protein
MRINKDLLIYVRMMVVGLAVFFVVLNIVACQTTWVFSKPNMTEQEFYKDDYECMRENQQVSSAAYVNRYGGGSSSDVVVNQNLYRACMQSRGYSIREQ